MMLAGFRGIAGILRSISGADWWRFNFLIWSYATANNTDFYWGFVCLFVSPLWLNPCDRGETGLRQALRRTLLSTVSLIQLMMCRRSLIHTRAFIYNRVLMLRSHVQRFRTTSKTFILQMFHFIPDVCFVLFFRRRSISKNASTLEAILLHSRQASR